MADQELTELDIVSSLTQSDSFYIVQGGNSRQVLFTTLIAALGGSDELWDAIVNSTADLAQYAGQNVGYKVMVRDTGNGRAALYTKTAAGWSNPLYWTGGPGGPGEDGEPGPRGDSVTFAVTDTHIQWKYTLEDTWYDLIALSELEGPQGKNIELSKTPTHIVWRVIGGSTWTDLVALDDIRGDITPELEALRDQVSTDAQTVSDDKAATEVFKDRAENRATVAELWANAEPGVPIDDGEYSGYSARHYAKEAENVAGGGVTSVNGEAGAVIITPDKIGAPTIAEMNTALEVKMDLPAGTLLQYITGTGSLATLDKAAVGLGNVSNLTPAQMPVSTAQADALALKEDRSQKNVASGYAGLGADGRLLLELVPDILLGNVRFVDFWNASTNTPVIPPASEENKGHYYIVSVAGPGDWEAGDWRISNGVEWGKVDNTDAVQSVVGLRGAISQAQLRAALELGSAAYQATSAFASADSVLEVPTNTAMRHSHTNKAILDAVTAAFTTALFDKLNGIQTGAQVNPDMVLYQTRVERNAVNGYAGLDSSGKIPESLIPSLAIGDIFEVSSEAAMLALNAQNGDLAIRSDINKTFALKTRPANVLANWAELRTPTDVVQSVVGLTGVINQAQLRAALGLGSAAYVASTAFATAAEGVLAQNAIAKGGDTGLGGFTSIVGNYGNSSGANHQIDRGSSNFKSITNNGAFTLRAPPDQWATYVMVVIPAAGAGALTTLNFTEVNGTFVPGKVNRLIITMLGSVSILDMKAVN